MGKAGCATSDKPSAWLMIGHSICSRLIIQNTTLYDGVYQLSGRPPVILVRTLSFPFDLTIVRL